MHKTPLVSIIIPSFNSRKFIRKTLESVLKTSYKRFEIIIVDNGSTDGSGDFLMKTYRRVTNVKVIKLKRNTFFTGGCNSGAKIAKGKKLVFLNSDCVVSRNWLTELVSCALSNPKTIIQPKILRFDDQNIIDNVGGRYSIFGLGRGIGKGREENSFNQNMKIDYANGTCFLIDSLLFRKVDGFDNWFKFHYEDVDLCLRAEKKGVKSYFCHKSRIFHKVSLTFKSNIPKETFLLHIRKNRLMVIHKNFKGIEKLVRYILIFLQYGILVFTDIFRFDLNTSFVTVSAIYRFLNRVS